MHPRQPQALRGPISVAADMSAIRRTTKFPSRNRVMGSVRRNCSNLKPGSCLVTAVGDTSRVCRWVCSWPDSDDRISALNVGAYRGEAVVPRSRSERPGSCMLGGKGFRAALLDACQRDLLFQDYGAEVWTKIVDIFAGRFGHPFFPGSPLTCSLAQPRHVAASKRSNVAIRDCSSMTLR
jgi:hypothetical protein